MILLFDFGASRIKSAAFRPETGELTDHRESDGGARVHGPLVPPDYFAAVFRRHLDAHAETAGRPPDAIWIASEMHGFLLVDRAGAALTPFVSWRADLGHDRGNPALAGAVIAGWGADFLAITGMRPRVGLPAVNLAILARTGGLPAGGRLAGIPEGVIAACGTWAERSHLTLAAATGLVDLGARTWSDVLARELHGQVALPAVVDDPASPLGTVPCGGRNVPVHGGIGDLQAALAALALRPEVLSLNLGTGSQVSRLLATPDRGGAELRPFFDGTVLRAQTHIAAGRGLAAFADLFDGIAAASGGAPGAFWRLAAGLHPAEVADAAIAVDPAVFDAAWRFGGGGRILNLLEGRMDPRGLVAGICRGWLAQYPDASALVDPERETTEVLLSGGLPRRLPFVPEVVGSLLGRPARLAPVATDETLHGLSRLAGGQAT